MVGNPCLLHVSMNEGVRLWMKLDCHIPVDPVLSTDTSVLHNYTSWRPVS